MLNPDGELPPEFPVSKVLAQVLQQSTEWIPTYDIHVKFP